MRGKEDFRDSPEPESKFLFPSRDSGLDFVLGLGLGLVIKCSTICFKVPGLLSGCGVVANGKLGLKFTQLYSDFDNWKCTSPRQHQHCTGSLWLGGLPSSSNTSSLNPRTSAQGGPGPEA